MKLAEVRRNAFAIPLNNPAYPPGPYKFYNREFVVITYRTDIDKLRAVVPEPLEVAGDTVAYEFIRMPDSTGFGDYTETGQVIPVRFQTRDGTVQEGGYVHAMYLDDNAPIAGGREIWGFPKKLASPKVAHEGDVVVCTLHYGSVLCVSATMGFKHREIDPAPLLKALARPKLHAQDHPTCRLHAANLRAGALLHGRSHGEGRLGRPGRNSALRACAVRRGAAAGSRGGLGYPLCDRPDVGSRRGRVRLSEGRLSHAERKIAMSRFDGKVGIITGAASGIGKEIALRFAAEGGTPVIADLNLDAADATAREIRANGSDAFAVGMNVADEAAVEKGVADTMAKFGRIDVLVSNAGIQIVKPIVDFPFADWKRLLAIHLDGAFLTTKACLKHMYKAKSGSIVYMGSVHSKEASMLKAPYVTAKHGLLGLCRVVAKEGAQYNVRANVVCPGFVRTPLVDKQIPEQAKELGISEEDVIKHVMLKDTVDGEFTTTEDVAEAVLFCAGFKTNALTGQSLVVSHGWFME